MENLGMIDTANFWQGKRVLLTGHTGFKGSWLAIWLQQLGAEVVGIALAPNTMPNLFDLAHVKSGMTSHFCDIRNVTKMVQIVRDACPEIVFHLAAQPLVRASYRDPLATYATNVMGTANLLDALRGLDSVKVAVMITTDKVYCNNEWNYPYRETDALGGHDPYSASKAATELVTSSFISSYFSDLTTTNPIRVSSARAGNVIGGGDWAQDRLIPDILNAFEQGRKVAIRNPYAIRPWQHVMEPLCGYLTLAELLFAHGPSFGEAWNFGPNDEDAKSVEWIVKEMALLWGADAQWQVDPGEHPHEAHYLKLDISKARSRLDWRPALRLEESLSLIIEWSKQFSAGTNMRQLTLDQIQYYQSISK